MYEEVVSFYIENRSLIDSWAKSADHPLLRACARVIRDTARAELSGEHHNDASPNHGDRISQDSSFT